MSQQNLRLKPSWLTILKDFKDVSAKYKSQVEPEECQIFTVSNPARISKNHSHWISKNSLYMSFFRNVISESNQIDSLENAH